MCHSIVNKKEKKKKEKNSFTLNRKHIYCTQIHKLIAMKLFIRIRIKTIMYRLFNINIKRYIVKNYCNKTKKNKLQHNKN